MLEGRSVAGLSFTAKRALKNNKNHIAIVRGMLHHLICPICEELRISLGWI